MGTPAGEGARPRAARHRRWLRWSFATVASQVAMAVGISCAVLRWDVAATLWITCLFAASGAFVARETRLLERRGLRALLECGAVLGFAATAVMGALAVLGVLGCLVLLPFLGTQRLISGVVTSYVRDRFGWADPATGLGPGQVDRLETSVGRQERVELDLLDDVALCRTWRHSFLRVESAASADTLHTVAEHRRRCLDEIERRNPAGFAAWLASGGHAASDPLPFLAGPERPPST